MRRPDYQNLGGNLEEITDARNEVIRAWGRKILSDADAHILADVVRDGNDWDLIEEEPHGVSSQEVEAVVEQEVVPPAEPETEEATLPPALQEQIEQQIADVQSGKTVPKPRTKPKPATS